MTTVDSNLLLFQVGPVPCCVNSDAVKMVIEPPAHITAIPGSNAYRPGLMVYHKRAVSVYDVRTKFNLSTEQRGKIIITEMNSQLFGFWVDKIQAVLTSDQGKWQILPTECPKELFEAVFMYKKQLIFKTSFIALAKAQVNTQVQHFINKLLIEEQKQQDDSKEKNIAQIKTTLDSTTINNVNKKSENSENSENSDKTIIKKSARNTIPPKASHTESRSTTKTPTPTTPTNLTNSNSLSSSKLSKQANKKTPSISNQKKENDVLLNSKSTNNRQVPTATESWTKRKSQERLSKQHQISTPPLKKEPIVRKINKDLSTPSPISIKDIKTVSNNRNTIKSSEHNTTPSPSKTDNTTIKEQPPGNTGIVLLFILIIGLPSIGWYLFSSISSNDKTTSKTNYKPSLVLKEKETPLEKPNTSATLKDETKAIKIDTQENEYTENIIKTNKPTKNFLSNETTLASTDSSEIKETAFDSTEINNNGDTITIIINDNNANFNQETIKQEDTRIESIADSKLENKTLTTHLIIKNPLLKSDEKTVSVDINVKPSNSIAISEPSQKEKTSPTITTRKIIHTIVRGDTLWHIAKRYILDPYKYPQLAKLSKIKNPDLIYPGNNVIIIIKSRNTQ